MKFDRIVLGSALVLTALSLACATPSPAPDAGTSTGGGATTAPATGGAAAPAQPAEPAKPPVNRLVMAVQPPRAETNDPRTERGPTNWPFRPFYEYLIGVDTKTGKYVPQLATEWKLEPDNQSFRIKLREGVKFHQGKGDWNADTFIESIAAQVSDKDLSNYLLINALIEKIEKVGPYEVIVHLKKKDGTFLLTISEQRGVVYGLNGKHLMEMGTPDWKTGPAAGTGAYQLKEREQDQYVRYERAPGKHWRVTPDFPEFEFRYIKEASSRLAALITGEVHMTDLPEDLKAEAQSRGYKLIDGQVDGLRSFIKTYCCHMKDQKDPTSGWEAPEGPLTDVRVRKALSKAIDRDTINKALFGGQGKLMYLAHFNPNRDGWDPTWQTRFKDEYGYDVNAAKQLLADAGYSTSKPLTINALFPTEGYGYSGADDIMDAIANMWREVGVNVEYVTIELARRRQMTDAHQLTNHLVLGGTSSDIWTGRTTYGSTQGTSQGTGMEIPEADALLAKVRGTLNEDEQDKLWRQVGEVDFMQHREIPLFWIPVQATVDPKIVSDYDYPGAITGAWTHVYNIKAAK